MPTDIIVEQPIKNKLTRAKFDELQKAGQINPTEEYYITDDMIKASEVSYDNKDSGLLAESVQTGIDELADKDKQLKDYLDRAANQEYHDRVLMAKSTREVDNLFIGWWKLRFTPDRTKQSLVEEWFRDVLYDDRVHGVRFPLFAKSTSPDGEFTDDSVGLVCEASTAQKAGRDDFAYLPQFWTLEVSALKNEDGTHEFVAVEHIDPIEEVRNSSQKALTWVLQKNTYRGEGIDGEYCWLKTRCTPKLGYKTWDGGTDKNGRVYAYMGYPKYACGVYADGSFGCATGLAPALWYSQVTSVQKWRERGTQYAGVMASTNKWQIDMFRLKYAQKGNSKPIPGCNYYYQSDPAAISEVGVKRILVASGSGAHFHVGSTVNIDNAKHGRSQSSPVVLKRIEKIEPVIVADVTYDAIYLETDEVFDTTAGTSHITTMPYHSGWNDNVQGYDGSRISPTSGSEPGLIQRTEFMNGAYLINANEFWKWGTNEAGEYTLDTYLCNDSSKITTNGTISSDYVKQEGLTLTYPSDQAGEWQYIEDLAVSEGGAVTWPYKTSKTAGSGTGVQDGFYLSPSKDAVRAAWRCGGLDGGGGAGLASGASGISAWDAVWGAAPGSSGLAG